MGTWHCVVPENIHTPSPLNRYPGLNRPTPPEIPD